MNDRRLRRLEAQIQQRIAEILLREIADPKIGLITITRVELDSEFTVCKAFWSVLGDQRQRAGSERALARARGFMQREVGKTLATRTVPHLAFVFDASIAGALKMQQTLEELRQERQQRTGEAGSPVAAPGEVDAPAAEAGGATAQPDAAPDAEPDATGAGPADGPAPRA